MPRTIRASAILAIAAIAFIVGACASGAASASGPAEAPGVGIGAPVGAGGIVDPDVAGGPIMRDGNVIDGGEAPPVPGEGQGNGAGTPDDARIVRTGTMDLEVTDVDQAVAAARTAIAGFGGYIGASNASDDGEHRYASVTYRIPVDRWEEALAALRSLGGIVTKVVGERTDAVEVTSQIVDLEARIKNLRASEAALQEIAASATKVSDVLEVQAQLTAVRGQIEQLTAQLTEIGDRADLGTMTATYQMPVVAIEEVRQGWDPGAQIDQATASLVGVLQSVATFGIWFAIVLLPVLAVIGIVAFITIRILRRIGVGSRPAPPEAPATTAG